MTKDLKLESDEAQEADPGIGSTGLVAQKDNEYEISNQTNIHEGWQSLRLSNDRVGGRREVCTAFGGNIAGCARGKSAVRNTNQRRCR